MCVGIEEGEVDDEGEGKEVDDPLNLLDRAQTLRRLKMIPITDKVEPDKRSKMEDSSQKKPFQTNKEGE